MFISSFFSTNQFYRSCPYSHFCNPSHRSILAAWFGLGFSCVPTRHNYDAKSRVMGQNLSLPSFSASDPSLRVVVDFVGAPPPADAAAAACLAETRTALAALAAYEPKPGPIREAISKPSDKVVSSREPFEFLVFSSQLIRQIVMSLFKHVCLSFFNLIPHLGRKLRAWQSLRSSQMLICASFFNPFIRLYLCVSS